MSCPLNDEGLSVVIERKWDLVGTLPANWGSILGVKVKQDGLFFSPLNLLGELHRNANKAVDHVP